MDTCSTEDALKAWVQSHVGRGRTFSSGRQWSAAADLNPTAVSTIETTGKSTCSKLIALARAAGEPALRVLVLAGYLRENEAWDEGIILPEEEQKLLTQYRLATPALRHAALEVLLAGRE